MSTTGQRSTRVRDVERAVRRVRWGGIVFSIVMPLLFEPTAEGVRPSVDLFLAGAIMTITLCTVQAISLWTERLDVDRTRRVGWVILVVDALVATSVPIVYAFDHFSDFWPLLTFVIIEGAVRGGMPTALGVWAVGAGAHALNSWRLLDTRPNPDSWIASIPWAVGILLMVAVGAGALGSRVAASDDNVDAWRRRLEELTRRTQGLGASLDVETALDEVAAIATWLANGARAAVSEPDRPPPAWSEHCVAVDIAGTGELQLHIEAGPDELTHDELALFDLLGRHARSAIDAIEAASVERERAEVLRRLAEQKNQFLVTLAHELRTPMTIIKGNTLLLAGDGVLPEDATEYLRASVSSNLDRFERLLSDATDAMQIDAQLMRVAPEALDLHPLITGVVEDQVGQSPSHDGIVDVPDGTPAALADPQRLAQVLHNVVRNAVRYSPEGGTISVSTTWDDTHVLVAVRDEGVGIPEDAMPRLFGRLERLHPDLPISGTGLGLNLSRDLVEAMAGTITATSEEGVGSTFTIRLPRVVKPRPAVPMHPELGIRGSGIAPVR